MPLKRSQEYDHDHQSNEKWTNVSWISGQRNHYLPGSFI